jgi:hypothetical protein
VTPQQTTIRTIVAPSIGNIVTFGTHGGKPLEWQVLDVQNSRALLLTKYVVEPRRYHDEWGVTTWVECGLHAYLNGIRRGRFDFRADGFLQNRFTTEERSRIWQVKGNKTLNNPWWTEVSGGSPSDDYVFLLSLEEVCHYFGSEDRLKAGSGKGGNSIIGINDANKTKRVAKLENSTSSYWWWLRSPGLSGLNAAFVNTGGSVNVSGHRVINDGGGVRPALWLNF